MAIPTFNETGNMTLISNADTGTNWSITDVDTDIKVEGVGAGFDAIRNGGTITYTFGTAQNMSAANTMIRIWLQHTFPSYLQTKALGGIQLFLSDGTNTGYWYVGGSDTHNGAYELFQADISATVDSGTAPTLSSITSFGFVLDHATAARNVDNTYWDISWYGVGIEFYGGTTSDYVRIIDVASADTGTTTDKQYGIVELIKGGSIYLNHALFIGDSASTNNTYFTTEGKSIVFYSANEKSGSYQFKATGNATGTTVVNIEGSTIESSGTPFVFDMSSVNLTTLSVSGSKLKNFSTATFKSGQTIPSMTFEDGISVIGNGATFNAACNFIDATFVDTTLNNVTNSTFTSSGTGFGVDLTDGGTVTVSTDTSMNWNNTSSGYTDTTGNRTIKVSVDTGATLTINNNSGDTLYVENTGAGTVNIVTGQRTLTIQTQNGNEVRIRQGSYTLQHTQEVTGGHVTYTYSYSAGVFVTVSTGGAGYNRQTIKYELLDQDATLLMELEPSDSYLI